MNFLLLSMAYTCINCHKGNWKGRRSQHHKGVAGGSWKHKAQKTLKLFGANIHSMKLLFDKEIKRVKLCTDCISLLRKKGQLLVKGHRLTRLNLAPVKATK